MSKVATLDSFTPEFDEDLPLFQADLEKARQFLSSKKWCQRIESLYLGITVPGVVLVCLADILPSGGADPRIWVVVGDLPSAYIVITDAPNPASALDAYIFEMTRWAEAVENGEDLATVIPVDGAPTLDNAVALRTRLELLRTEVLTAYQDDL